MTADIVLREKIIAVGVLMCEKKLVQGTGGNISARTESGFLITPSGMDYADLSPEDLVEMDLRGKVLSGVRKPSIESRLHLAVFEARADVNAVIHAHSICATAVAAARRTLKPITDNQVAVFGGAVPVAEYAPIGSDALAKNAVLALKKGAGVLLANHGSLCVGHALDEALLRCEMLETFADIFILAQIAGGGVALTDEEIRSEAEDLKRRYGQR